LEQPYALLLRKRTFLCNEQSHPPYEKG